MVYWEDIQSDSGWRTLKEIQKSRFAICVSTGWLVKENKDVHILMSDYNYDDNGELSDGGNTTVIPTKNVIEKFLIKRFIDEKEIYNETSEKKSKELDHYLEIRY